MWYNHNFGLRCYFEVYFPDENLLYNFALWAFGEKFDELCCADKFVDAWNNLHSDVLKLDMNGFISKDAVKMVDAWNSRE